MAVCVCVKCVWGKEKFDRFGGFSKSLSVKLVGLSARSWRNSEDQTDPEG